MNENSNISSSANIVGWKFKYEDMMSLDENELCLNSIEKWDIGEWFLQKNVRNNVFNFSFGW